MDQPISGNVNNVIYDAEDAHEGDMGARKGRYRLTQELILVSCDQAVMG